MGFKPKGYTGEDIPPGTAAGEILVWNGTAWVPNGAPGAVGDILVWDGSTWVPSGQSQWRSARVKFANVNLGGLSAGQLSSEFGASAGAASALPVNPYYSTKISDVPWRLLGLTVFVHFNAVPAEITFTVNVNNAATLLSTVVAAGTANKSTWLATPIAFASNPVWDYLSVTFGAAVPISGNNYYEANVFYEYLSPAPGGAPP